MAAYFVITFLAFILVPLTLSLRSGFLLSTSQATQGSVSAMSFISIEKQRTDGCKCQPCIDQLARVQKREGRSLLSPKIGVK